MGHAGGGSVSRLKNFREKEHYMDAWKRKMISVLFVMLTAAALFISSSYTAGNQNPAAGGFTGEAGEKTAGRETDIRSTDFEIKEE